MKICSGNWWFPLAVKRLVFLEEMTVFICRLNKFVIFVLNVLLKV